MPRRSLSFLTLFFIVLGIAFLAAIVWRAVSYSPRPEPAVVDTAATRNSGQPRPDTNAVAAQPISTVPKAPARPQILPIDQGAPPALPAGVDTATARRTTATAPAQAPSILSRLVAPIVNAFSGSKASSAQPSLEALQRSGSGGSTSQAQSHSTGTSHGDRTSTSEKDLSSDTQPPQLLAIAFNPPQVHDGEETQLVVQATDDLSGIRSISGTVLGPSGAAQGFACQREGETDRYVARIAVPKDAADGVWRVNYLSLIDFASNSATLVGAQVPQTASFRVISSAPDSQGPTLRAVWLDRPAMRAGEKNTVFVDAEDDKSGLGLISGVFISPAKFARIGFVCRPAEGPWQCDFSPPDCLDCGDWHLEQMQLQDKANNMTTVRSDNPILGRVLLNISGDRCDSGPPVLQSVVLDRNSVSNAEESGIGVTVLASDDNCGLMSISGQATGPTTAGGAPRLYFSFTQSGAAWNGRIVVPRLAAKGVWRITWIQSLDHGHNLKTYNAGDPLLVNAVFNVQ